MGRLAVDTYETIFCDTLIHYKLGHDMAPMARRICDFVAWVNAGLCIIRSDDSKLVPLTFNRSQRIIVGAMLTQAIVNRPVRLVILKARKRGTSTIAQAATFHACSHYDNQVALTLAHIPESTRDVFSMSRTMWESYPSFASKPSRESFIFDNGSRSTCHTAGGSSVGAGGTPSYLHLSEVALWKLNKRETHYAATNSVPEKPETMVIQESTARGRDLFFDLFCKADADPQHNYVPVFIPWFMDFDGPKYTGKALQYTDDERRLISLARGRYKIELGDNEIAWRRHKIDELAGGEVTFRQEFPSTPEEAVQAYSDLILPGMRECVVRKMPFNFESLGPDERVGGMDYGYHDPTVILSGVWMDQVLYVMACYRAHEAFPEDHIEGTIVGHTYWCDPSAAEGRAKLQALSDQRNKACVFLSAPRGKTSRDLNFVNAEWLSVKKIMDEGRLRIVEGCEDQLVTEADNLAWDTVRSVPRMVRSETCGHFDTLCALRYMVMGVLQGGDANYMPPQYQATQDDDYADDVLTHFDRRREFRL